MIEIRQHEPDDELAIRAARSGCDIVTSAYRRPRVRFAKDGTDFATDVDISAERAIRAVLGSARPADDIVGEELGGGGNPTAERTWLVDPLCGTMNYAAQTPLVAVNVGLRVGGAVTVAVAADPFAGETFWTAGAGAFVRRDGRDLALVPDPGNGIVDLNLDPPFPNGESFRAARLLRDDAFIARFRPRVLSTTLALAWVAAGRRAGYVTDGHLHDSVHFTSGISLCQAAGCVVTNLAGQPVHTGVQGLIAAADPATHQELTGFVARHWAPA